MTRRAPLSVPGLAGLVLVTSLLASALPAASGEALDRLEGRFEEVAERVGRAAVVVSPEGMGREQGGWASSGVAISPAGLILSDGDAGLYVRRVASADGTFRNERVRATRVRVRLVGPGGRLLAFPGRVLSRDLEADSSLIQLDRLPPGGLAWVPPGRSGGLEVGAFLFVAGTAFDENDAALPTVTAGILAAVDLPSAGVPGGRYAFLYTTAAVNQGVNGGAVVDLGGHLVGTVSSWVDPAPDAVHQMLGKVVPIDRIRALHAATPQAAALRIHRARSREGEDPARALELTLHEAAEHARRGVVSLDIRRTRPVSSVAPTSRDDASLPRWEGPVSGLVVSDDGWIVTSLYNVTNVGVLVFPSWIAPPGATVAEGIQAVVGTTAFLPGGVRGPARLVTYDERLGLVLFKVEESLMRRSGAAPLAPAFENAYRPGRFAIAVGDPYGADRRGAPLVTFGMLSKFHALHTAAPWRGQWQTDASGLDVNAGGAVVGLDGRLLGMMQLWYPARHGRHSGVAFVVPWDAIRAALPDLERGIRPRRGLLGVTFGGGSVPRIASVESGSGAARAGLRPGDLLHRVGGVDVATVDDVVVGIGVRYEGEEVALTFERDDVLHRVTVRLGARR